VRYPHPATLGPSISEAEAFSMMMSMSLLTSARGGGECERAQPERTEQENGPYRGPRLTKRCHVA